MDLKDKPQVEADIDYVVSLDRGTTIGRDDVKIHSIEHIMAAFHGLKIDNVLIELDGEEVPLCDGSALEFVDAIKKAGIEEQHEERRFIHIEKPLLYEDSHKALSIFPAENFHLTFMIDYNHPALGAQHTTMFDMAEEFVREYAPARTFCFLSEILDLYNKGLIKGGRINNAVVVQDQKLTTETVTQLKNLFTISENIFEGKNGFLNNTELRYPNELCRHKALDLIGDIYLIGAPLKAHLLAARSGHAANIEMARRIRKANIRPRASGTGKYIYDIEQIKAILPHRYPFLMVDRVIEIEKDKRILAMKNLTVNELFFQGHYPNYPIMPGVLQIEALAQTGGLLMHNTIGDMKEKVTIFMGIDECRFRRPVRPGDTLFLEVELTRFRGKVCLMTGRAMVNGEVTCEAKFMISVMDKR